MYLVINKNGEQKEPELYPSFLIKDLIEKAKSNKKIKVTTSGNYVELQSKHLWLLVAEAEFTSALPGPKALP